MVGGDEHQGLVNVPMKHHPNIGDITDIIISFNKYLKVMFKIPKMGHLPNPDQLATDSGVRLLRYLLKAILTPPGVVSSSRQVEIRRASTPVSPAAS